MAVDEFVDPKFVKDRLDKFTWSGDGLLVEIDGGTLVAGEISEVRSGTLDVIKTVSSVSQVGKVADIAGGTIDTVVNNVTVDATDLDIRSLTAADTPGRSWNLTASDVIGEIQGISGTVDTEFGSENQDIGGAVKNAITTVPSGSPGDFTRQPVHDRVIAGTAVSSISYANAVKVVKAVNKGGDTVYLQLNNSTGGTVPVDEHEGRRLLFNGVSTLYYKTPTATGATLDVEGWS